jgi:hypothetical protein
VAHHKRTDADPAYGNGRDRRRAERCIEHVQILAYGAANGSSRETIFAWHRPLDDQRKGAA